MQRRDVAYGNNIGRKAAGRCTPIHSEVTSMTILPWAERPENKANRLEYMKQWRRENPLKACVHTLVGGAKDRARKNGLEVDREFMTVANVLSLVPADMRCPCCKLRMVARVERGKHPHSITLDRVDNDRGYVFGNVAVICATCNSRKKDMSVHDLRLILRYIESYGA